MDYASNMSIPPYPKRPGSPLGDQSMPAAKVPRTNSSQLQINYLVRQKEETLPLVTFEERMPRILQLISDYDGVLQRHESMAGNLGACPLGPILLKRFERLFDGPPRVLKSHAKDPSITWLDVVEFAQNRPEQFNLEKQRNGVRVCQFYHKQCRVEISEEDFVLIASGMPQKLIPPQPILEDEEKELGVMEILERNLSKVVQMADQVSARARQLNHKLKNRRSAIQARRDVEGDSHRHGAVTAENLLLPMDLGGMTRPVRSIEAESQSPPLGFTAVNVRPSTAKDVDTRPPKTSDPPAVSTPPGMSGINGRPNSTVRADNLSKFLTESERRAGMTEDSVRRSSLPQLNRDAVRQAAQNRSRQEPMSASGIGYRSSPEKGSPSVAIPNTPASLMPLAKPNTHPKDDGGPYKAEMVARMENMARGERIIPPCDRCRRLQMDCMKNLTACQGCTRKHAKCSWKDVTWEELQGGGQTGAPGGEREVGQAVLETDTITVETPPRDWAHVLNDKDKPNRVDKRPPEHRPGREEVENVSPRERERDRERSSPRLALSPVSRPTNSYNNHTTSPKLDVRPPPLSLEQQLREASKGVYPHAPHQQGQYQSYTDREPSRTKSRGPGTTDGDEGDRLQELARQVYRSASQSVRPPMS